MVFNCHSGLVQTVPSEAIDANPYSAEIEPRHYAVIIIIIIIIIIQVSQKERDKLREGAPYVKLYRYNPKHPYPKLNVYGDNGQRKVWTSCISA